MLTSFTFASDSAAPGHPDKLCDRIADAIVDACLCADSPRGVVAECALASGVAFLALRHAGRLDCDPAAVARREIAAVGYAEAAFPADRVTVILDVTRDDAMPGPGGEVAESLATVFGYATAAAPDGLPAPIRAAHAVARGLDAARRDGRAPWLSPDVQAQVAVAHEARRPVGVRAVALRVAADPRSPRPGDVAGVLRSMVVAPALDAAGLALGSDARMTVSLVDDPRGPRAHAGLTGRKTAEDLYGGYARQGASALSGKDPSRPERVGAVAARAAALSVVSAGLAEECESRICYAPGESAPISVGLETFGSGVDSDDAILARVLKTFDFRAAAVAERFGLWRLPAERGGRFFAELACFGQMGRTDLDPPWERPVPLEG